MGATLTDVVRPLVLRGACTSDIIDAARAAGFHNSKSVAATASNVRRALGRDPLPRGNVAKLPEHVNLYLLDVSREYGISPAETRRRLLTIICDDDLAHAVLGDPPPKRRVGCPAKSEARDA
jgi:hypothetical protein